jgi:hypothetical protein
MATVPLRGIKLPDELADYPTGDGKPVGETPIHRDNLLYNVDLLRTHFATDLMTYVSGNMFLYYVEGDKRRHVSPDVFVVRGIPNLYRDAYFTWLEGGKGPDVVIEMTSPSTRDEDLEEKFALYRDVLHVREYFLFDPKAEYLDPPMQGFRLVEGQYVRIEPVDGRLPSAVMGLHLEAEALDKVNSFLRVYDPATDQWLPLPKEVRQEYEEVRQEFEQTKAALRQREAALQKKEVALEQSEAERQRLAQALKQAEYERQRLLKELEALRRQVTPPGA